MDKLDKLLAIEEIRALKARYFRCVDLKDWAGLAEVFAEDALFDISDDLPGAVMTGREKILAAVSEPLALAVSVHHGHCPEIEITSPTTATGVWAMEDMLRWPATAEAPARRLHGYGHYYETYERLGGVWRIKSLKLKRLAVDITTVV
jgi:hypothetical protein